MFWAPGLFEFFGVNRRTVSVFRRNVLDCLSSANFLLDCLSLAKFRLGSWSPACHSAGAWGRAEEVHHAASYCLCSIWRELSRDKLQFKAMVMECFCSHGPGPQCVWNRRSEQRLVPPRYDKPAACLAFWYHRV